MYKSCQCVANMKFRKEILVVSLIIIFMLMSAVSAEENITIDDGAITSDYAELDSDSSYNEDVSEDSILEDDVIDDENISGEDSEPDISPGSVDDYDASGSHGFNIVVNKGSATAGISLNKDFAFHKASSCSHYSKADGADVRVNERDVDEMFSNFQFSDDMGIEALTGIVNGIHAEDSFAKTYSSYREYFDYLKEDSLKKLIEENKIGDVFNGNTNMIDYLTYDLINFIGSGAKYVDFPIDVNAFLDIFDKIMNSPPTHNTMTNIPSFNNNSTLRDHKYYSDYSFYYDADSIINSYDLNDEAELFIGSDSNISDILISQDNMTLINQTFDLKTISDVCINSYENIGSDLQLSDDGSCWRDAYDNSDVSLEIQSFKFSQPIDCLSNNTSEDIQYVFYHMIGCECTDTGFTKQYASYDNLPEVSEFDTITSAEQEDNHDYVLFKHNVNAPFIVENASVFALFGVIKITIP